jgi:hypothetical protein
MKVCARLQASTCHTSRGLHQDTLVQTTLLHKAGNLVRRNNVLTPQKGSPRCLPHQPFQYHTIEHNRMSGSDYPLPRHGVSMVHRLRSLKHYRLSEDCTVVVEVACPEVEHLYPPKPRDSKTVFGCIREVGGPHLFPFKSTQSFQSLHHLLTFFRAYIPLCLSDVCLLQPVCFAVRLHILQLQSTIRIICRVEMLVQGTLHLLVRSGATTRSTPTT